jgi:hypothetical protein
MEGGLQSVQTFGRKARAVPAHSKALQIPYCPPVLVAEDGHRRGLLQARSWPHQDQRRADRARSAGGPPVQGALQLSPLSLLLSFSLSAPSAGSDFGRQVFEPVLLLGSARFSNVDIRIRVKGGGFTSQVYGTAPVSVLWTFRSGHARRKACNFASER